ncbi:unnamed protein product [Larinioides sclopetarius]|uniref:Uncharacterized protein n=1 Tax=Larinioides sclopetarius TaxID=280406 RepID=A0AAV2AJU1_9ARAC
MSSPEDRNCCFS